MTGNSIIAALRRRAVAESIALRGPYTPPPTEPHRTTLSFGLGCPQCAGNLELLATAQAEPRRSTATMRCAVCDIFVNIAVGMRVAQSLPRRFPVEPLIDWIVARNDTVHDATHEEANVCYVANRLGVDRHRIYQYRRYGLSDANADAFATRLNIHPTMIWPEYVETVPA